MNPKINTLFTIKAKPILRICLISLVSAVGLHQSVFAGATDVDNSFDFINHLVVPINGQDNYLTKTNTEVDDRGEYTIVKSHLYSNALAVIVLTHRWKETGAIEHRNKAEGILTTLAEFQYRENTPNVAGAYPNLLISEDYHVNPGPTQPYCAAGSSKMVRNGNNAWFLIAMGYYTAATGDRQFVPQIEALADYLSSRYAQNQLAGSPTEGAIFTGWGSTFETTDSHKSFIVTEHQCQAFSGLLYAAEIIGNEPRGERKAQHYLESAHKILKFTLSKLYNPNNPLFLTDAGKTRFHPGVTDTGQVISARTSLDAQTWTNLAFGRALTGIEDISEALDYAWNHMYASAELEQNTALPTNFIQSAEMVDPECTVITRVKPSTGMDQVFGVSSTHQPVVGYGASWFEGDQGIWLAGTAQLAYAFDYAYDQLNSNLNDKARGERIFKRMSAMEWQADAITINSRTYSWPQGGFQVFSDGYIANSESLDCVRPEAYPHIEPTAWRYFHMNDLNPYAISLSTPPAAPANFAVTKSLLGGITLSWNKDPMVVSYCIMRNGEVIGHVNNLDNSRSFFVDNTALPGLSNTYSICARDLSGQLGTSAIIKGDAIIQRKLVPKDGAENDFFGASAVLSGNTVIVGAPGDDENGKNCGSVYLIDSRDGGVMAKLLASDRAENHRFGHKIASDGTIAVITAIGDGDNGAGSGSAYVFDLTTGAELRKLVPDDGSENNAFGSSVAIHGNIVIIGAMPDNDQGIGPGSAYLFDINTGKQLHKLLPDDGAMGDQFGWSVAIEGTIAVVGSPKNNGGRRNSGATYLFDTHTGRQLLKLVPARPRRNAHFGKSIAIEGTTLLIGASRDRINGHRLGAAYVFDASNGEQLFKLSPSDGSKNDRFGCSVALEENIAVIGAKFNDDNGGNSGSAYVFDVNTGNELQKLLPKDGSISSRFGYCVEIDAGQIIVGVPKDTEQGEKSGAVYLFKLR